jgi:hypothetical protein
MAKGDREAKKANERSVLDYLQQRGLEDETRVRVRRNSAATAAVGREALFSDQLKDALSEVFTERVIPKFKPGKSKGKTQRILNVIFSDTHYGSDLDPRELGHKYGPVEEARRTAAVCREVAQYKLHYRSETELYVHILGDIIQGQLHDQRDGKPLAEQASAAIRIFVNAITYLAQAFPKGVTVLCTPGNHGRNSARHRERAVNQKWDSIETIIYTAIKEAVRNISNVKVLVDYPAEYEFESFDNVGYATHGDTHFNPGYPGKNVDAGGLKRQMDSKNNARVLAGKKPYSLFIVGHVHVGTMLHLPGGAIALTNGCLLPPDAYAKTIGIDTTSCGQWMWESVKGHIVGDARFITVDFDTDKDDSLDGIIQPVLRL